MRVKVVDEEEGRSAIVNRPPQVTAAMWFLGLRALVLVLYVIPKGAEKLKNPERQMQAAIAREAREQSLQTGATGVSRITKETERVGKSLYTYASLPFEIASLLLLVAIIGSVMLARTLKQEIAADDVDAEVSRHDDPKMSVSAPGE